ncbi:protein-transporting protein BCP1 [Aspergillus brunneoviolaceus CBS 621.78]|uniref:Protein bcp1 n=1 Tax=Aspergillus brunneoviolaceus CBS 621.78 TaxID=1450534 RepID=A0ACD1GAZ4_9EURO|nr:protein bcp1 [Aspergillus brunneoviolaceus CBS 621.78]RAH46408.1 protein bcp1 [Aspergillus brunneoviolaceus CBS 621.78]
MVKRKEIKDTDVDMGGTDPRVENDSDSDEDIDMVNVDFEWFDPDPEVDFHGLKNLLRQLFDNDAQDLDMSALTDLILSQAWMGSTIKTDGKESDPYAFLTVLNLQEHKDKPIIQSLTHYLHQKASTNAALSPLVPLLSGSHKIGLLLTERLINMPAEVVPPMYTMLQQEIAHAVADNEPFDFSHYLLLSKTYEEVQSKLDMEESRPLKKGKKSAAGKTDRFFFHPEDEVLEKHALCAGSFEYSRKQDDGHSDSKRAFQELGIRTKGSLILIERGRLEGAVKAMAEYVGSGGQ